MSKQEAAGALAVVAGAILATVLFWPSDGGSPVTAPPRHGSRTAAPPHTGSRVLAVKVDNVAAARPQTGVGAADVVYVEQIEGGLTRLMAVYCSDPPPAVGPVRSARFSDIQLLAQFGHPTLAYSGAASELAPLLSSASLVERSEAQAPEAYHRDGSRPMPHNLYLHPGALPPAKPSRCPPVADTGPPPGGGTPMTTGHASYPAVRYRFHWSPDTANWSISMNGSPVVDTASGAVAAKTVVLRHVPAGGGPSVADAAGHAAPNVTTVGHGTATVLRDGASYRARWSRPDPGAATTYRTADGDRLPLGSGPVWVLLLPSG